MAQNIVVDIRTRGHNPVAYTHQGDTTRTFVFEIYENGEEFSLSGYTAKIGAVLPSDNGYYVIAGAGMVTGTIATNKITATLTADYSRKAGNGFLTIILTNSSGSLRPINIDFRIQESSDGDDVIAGASDFPNFIEEYMADNMASYIEAWLDDHPEATTTVQDGSITEAKLSEALKLKTVNAYVTPEMFGAVGDGVTDDLAAIQAAINSGLPVAGQSNDYKIDGQLVFDGFNSNVFDFSGATIHATGNDFAVKITNSENSVFRIKRITSTSSNGVLLESLSASDYVQYLQLYIDEINIYNTSKVCIEGHCSGSGWVNEISVWNTRLFSSGGGIHLKDEITAYQDGMNSWKFYNVGCEGYKTSGNMLKYGFFFDCLGTAATRDFLVVGPRAAESLEYFMKANGTVRNVLVVSAFPISESMFNLSTGSSSWVIYSGENTRRVFRGTFIDDIDFGLVGKKITSGTNLNTLPCGRFNVPDNTIADTLTNKPTGAKLGNITVEMLSDTGDITHKWAIIKQTYFDYTNKTWTRVLTTDGATPPGISAGAWKEL